MKVAKALFVAVIVDCLFLGSLAWSDNSSVERQIKEATNKIVAAQMKGDADAYGRLLADDYTSVRAGKLATKADEVGDMRSGALKYEKSEILDIKIQAYRNAAVATSRNSFKGTVNGTPVSSETLVTRVWVKQKGEWKAVSMHSTRVPAAMPRAVPPFSNVPTPSGVVPVTSEPNHKIRFDNGSMRLYEVLAPKGTSTLVHEHRADSFTVWLQTAEITNEAFGGKAAVFKREAGDVSFASAANGPYSHRIIVTGEPTFHVFGFEVGPRPGAVPTSILRPTPAFKTTLENARGRVYRYTLAPGESTPTFTRLAGTMVFAISAGRVSEAVADRATSLWDFESGHFKHCETTERLSVKNAGPTAVDLVEIEVF